MDADLFFNKLNLVRHFLLIEKYKTVKEKLRYIYSISLLLLKYKISK